MHDPYYDKVKNKNLIEIVNLNHAKDNNFSQSKLSCLIKSKIEKKEYFYGIEVTAKSINNNNNILDYNLFNIQPLFTSIVWIGEIYADLKSIEEIPAVKCANTIKRCNTILPHLTCYRMTDEKLKELLDDTVNVLILRGDKVDKNQKYEHSIDLIKRIKKLKGDNISIGVGGYPEGHPDSLSIDQDLYYLREKIAAGADFIITQICFSDSNIKTFVENCRQNGINVSIIPGIYVPDNFKNLCKMIEITKIKMSQDLYEQFKNFENDNETFKKFAIQNAIKIIKNLFESNLNIYGIQLFTLNKFDIAYKIVNKLFTTLKNI